VLVKFERIQVLLYSLVSSKNFSKTISRSHLSPCPFTPLITTHMIIALTLQWCKCHVLYHKHIICKGIQSKVSILLNHIQTSWKVYASAVWGIIHTFYGPEKLWCCGWLSEWSANISMFVPCTPVEASIAHKNSMEMVVVIYTFLVVSYFKFL